MWEGGEQPLKRHFSEPLDSPSVRACLLLVAANCGREGFVPLLDALHGCRGLLALDVSLSGWGMWTLPAAGAVICCGSGAGCGWDRQPWSPERPCCCRHQVPDRRQ